MQRFLEPIRPLQFAVVREDPRVERAVVEGAGVRRALLVASGGCTALALARCAPGVELELFDVNPAQLEHVRGKWDAVRAGGLRALNVGDPDPAGWNARGNFEGLFRTLAQVVHEFVCPRDAFAGAFSDAARLRRLAAEIGDHPYWPVAFDSVFHDSFLRTMFGPAAIQHAPAGSYPRYFQALFERGLRRPDGLDNPFLHHVWLGCYLDRPEALPDSLAPGGAALGEPPPMHLGTLSDVPDLDRFDLVSLSNLPDWMSEDELAELSAVLTERLRPGARILLRQLNSALDLEAALGPAFSFDRERAAALLRDDRSLFYSRLHLATLLPGSAR